jgi:ferredoxin-NADP reductase
MGTCIILENRSMGRGNRWLKLQVQDSRPLTHEPGTVVGLSLRHGQDVFRHVYTVSRADPEKNTLEFLYRVIPGGRMTPLLEALAPGAELQMSGKAGHPIMGEVDTRPEGIVLVSTGTGIGPLYGFSRMALDRNLKIPLKLFAGFREAQDACLEDELGRLAGQHANFEWRFSLSRPDAAWTGLRGHVTESMAEALGPVRNLHFHLVGNGNMVVELYEVLMKVGLKDERVTSEIYFNYPETLDPDRLKLLASKFVF